MDAADFERVYQASGEFHSFFAPLFGRRESRDHSRHYLHAVLVVAGDRRNAETSPSRWVSPSGRCSAFLPKRRGTMIR